MIFKAPPTDPAEQAVIGEIDKARSQLRYALSQPRRWNGLLRRNTFARAVQGSNSIEGYNVTIDDAVAAVEGEEPLEPKDEAWAAVTGYRQAMTLVLQKADDAHFEYSAELLKSLHFMMTGHDLAKNPGRWRPGPIFVQRSGTGERVYEGPPVEQVPGLISALLVALAEPGDSPFVDAAMAHLNLVMIHPFSDGNGRMGRCLQTLVLARSGNIPPVFSSIEEYLGRNTEAYYRVLAEVGQGSWNPGNSARPWIRFCLTAHYRQVHTLLRRQRTMENICNELERRVEQSGLPNRCVLALADAAIGYRVRNPTYRNAADVTEATAGRDLRALVKAGYLQPVGDKRGRHYVAADGLRELAQRYAEKKLVGDPFAAAG